MKETTRQPKSIDCPETYSAKDSEMAQLLALLGHRKFKAVQKAFGGRRLWIPKPGASLTCGPCQLRNRCVLVWRKQGHSAHAISRFLRLSPKTVYRIARQQAPRAA